MENEEIARRFEFVAGLLESRNADPYRIQAYRNAAKTLRSLDRDVSEIAENEGTKGLLALPGIGKSLARSIMEFLYTGRMSALERVRGRTDPISLIASLAGIGPELAQRIYEQLGVETLEELEIAAREGDLAEVPGFGPKRIRGIIDMLAGRLGTRMRRLREAQYQPSVTELLDVDREYREKAESGQLRKIAPRRFNPSGEAWLPILNTRRNNDFYTALYSNTPRAHEMHRIGDWVVIYYDTPRGSGQATIVTYRQGELSGKRVVRGRENESQQYYQDQRAA